MWRIILDFFDYDKEDSFIFICLRVVPTIIGFIAALLFVLENISDPDGIFLMIIIGIIFGVVAGFISIYIVGIPLTLCWSFIVFLASSMGVYFSKGDKERHIKQKIEKLREKARRKRISEKAKLIVRCLGCYCTNEERKTMYNKDPKFNDIYKDDKIIISILSGGTEARTPQDTSSYSGHITIEIPEKKGRSKLVFEGGKYTGGSRGYSGYDNTKWVRDSETGDYEQEFHHEAAKAATEEVNAYVSGEWERHFDMLYSKALKKKEEREKTKELERDDEIEKSKEKFGL